MTLPEATAAPAPADPSPAPRRGRPRDARVEEAVLDAAMTLLATDGFAGTTVDAVAGAAGVSKASIYRRWPSREQLLLDAWRRTMRPMEVPDTGDLRNDLRALYRWLVEGLTCGMTGRVLPHAVAAAVLDPEVGCEFRDYIATRRAAGRTVLERAQRRGEIGPDVDLDVVQDTLVGPLFYRQLVSGEPLDAPFADAVIDLVLAALGVPADDPSAGH